MNKHFKYNITVRGYELDSFNHLNNAVYLNYLEQARWCVFKELDMLDYLSNNKYSIVVIETNIRYIKELKLFDEVEIQTSIKMETPYLVFLQKIFIQKDNKLASKSKTKALMVDSELNPVDVPEKLYS